MIKNRSVIYWGVAIVAMMLSFRNKPFAIPIEDSRLEFGDTLSFSPYKAGGWSIISSYLNQDTPDSVQFELILKRTGRIDGKTDQFIGTITNKNFLPVKDQRQIYYLLHDNVWNIRVTTKGECYLKQERGSALKASHLPGNPDVIPIKIRYKNK